MALESAQKINLVTSCNRRSLAAVHTTVRYLEVENNFGMSWCMDSSCLQPSTGTAGTTFTAALHFFALQQCLVPQEWPGDNIQDGDSFDFVVVGAGSAGFTLAARLAEVPHWRVLLVEAGDAPPIESIIPGLQSSILGSEFDWDFRTVDDGLSAQGLQDRNVVYTRGKMLGGSSSINYMMYARGNPADYSKWASRSLGWDWESVLPYFKKTENMKDQLVLNSPETSYLHGTRGPLFVSRPEDFGAVNNNMMQAFEEIGIPKYLDINGMNQIGTTPVHFTSFNGIRQSTAQIFSRQALNSTNFHVLRNAVATKILFDEKIKKAIGIDIFLQSGSQIKVFASNEIISSGGIFGSPQLLLLSGIGPKKALDKLEIPVKADLPVGKNLSDHIACSIFFTGLHNPGSNADASFQHMQYLYNKTGLLSYILLDFLTGYFRNEKTDYGEHPKYQLLNLYLPASSLDLETCKTDLSIRYANATCESLVSANKYHDLYQTIIILLHPESRGRVYLKSKEPTDHPLIETGFFSNKNDITSLAEGISTISRLVDTSFFRSMKSEIVRLDIDKCKHLEFKTIEYWKCYGLALSTNGHHGAGSCSMGPHGVVDSDGKVKGINGLRVVDMSIVPVTIGGNTNAPAIMVAEKIANSIKTEQSLTK